MTAKKTISDDLRREIEVRAYLLWESEGRPHGREHDHWQRAEAEILGGVPETKAKTEKKAVRPKSDTKSDAKPAAGTPKAAVAAKAKKPPAKTKSSKPS